MLQNKMFRVVECTLLRVTHMGVWNRDHFDNKYIRIFRCSEVCVHRLDLVNIG